MQHVLRIGVKGNITPFRMLPNGFRDNYLTPANYINPFIRPFDPPPYQLACQCLIRQYKIFSLRSYKNLSKPPSNKPLYERISELSYRKRSKTQRLISNIRREGLYKPQFKRYIY